ncbi:fructose PTS transporter subunit IIA [Cryobacterium sp. 1639]|uniref:PTS sugar transporter subunit IIA n=1 Tax=Cryobacterium inferilacus TaxID=2866629 RepID=UPI001C72EED6|nr:fructose PTS transporter subunit IIA [Cryobacterium sp. 1639]MBX0299069.1 fructose PTS transporter subunit IIA [Cryobacterium sp. 1639]
MPDTPSAGEPPPRAGLARRWAARLRRARKPAVARAPEPAPTAPPTEAPHATVLDYIDERTIALDIDETDRDSVIRRLATMMATTGIVLDVDAVVQAALDREEISTTGIGEGIAIPHAATPSCTAPLLGFARSRSGVDWNSLDGAPATLIFMIAVPETGVGTEHLKVLAHLSRSLMTPSFRDEIERAPTAADVLAALAASVRPSGPAAR